jgi:S-DNA-T family DNA segregation ATPase FtsK/SpoIIIE
VVAKKNNHSKNSRDSLIFSPSISGYLLGLAFFLAALVLSLSFFNLAGRGGQNLFTWLIRLLGKSAFLSPLFLILLASFFFVFSQNFRAVWGLLLLATVSVLLGLSSVLSSLDNSGGLVGFFLSWPLLKIFGFWVNLAVFGGLIVFGFFVFWQMAERARPRSVEELAEKPGLVKKIFEPKLKIKTVPTAIESKLVSAPEAILPELKTKSIGLGPVQLAYKKPGLELLEIDQGAPLTGDIKNNSAIIKKTLETFDIPVEMGEVNVGPTVTQYTLKPAEGIKLSKITILSNDLSLALAVHPIRIEAPIPGKPLVGIEIPNRTRVQVRLRNLFESADFRSSSSQLLFALGRDVAGNAAFADLGRMPHLLVAGSTGAGKTICLNTLILGLIFRNSPNQLRLILIDPKRVEFPVYENLPHLLTPVIFDSAKAVMTLKWLVKEMERRFEVLAKARARDINAFNRNSQELLPYVVVVIDELADLMASRGKEVEAGIVRLAQMARAVGIHLVVATQRPSVEVITGLIKANITSRITFQVASQVDSRTVIDMAGAEKLLGAGDMLFVSSETAKPRRLQGAYVVDKEVKRVVEFLAGQEPKENFLSQELERELSASPESMGLETGVGAGFFSGEDDPLYDQAKKWVIESKKASASLLQRRLRVGYARAARLLDLLEERGVVGPADGAKPREVYLQSEAGTTIPVKTETEREEGNNDDWEKV